ncbi:MAG: hypothetical protein ACE5Q6_27225, partial [Dehalococcoidia bacterium]
MSGDLIVEVVDDELGIRADSRTLQQPPGWTRLGRLGLAVHPVGISLNAANNRILCYDPQSGAVADFRRWTNRTVRLTFDGNG